MKLSKVDIYGFKSFARRTDFEFGPGVSAIVGPNGCGKSNLVDAIRWALGEQRTKALRSSNMADVVYRGAAANVNHAEVQLSFDNTDHSLPHPAPEITISRRLGTDGISEYQLNGTPARLKDVRELFLDTGLGVGGYAFMEQGRIDAILQSGAAERRLLVEEAAGTSRYRLRRKEAVRKLDRTEQDLARAGDLLAELERQVRSLKVQAGRARNYRNKRDRLERALAVYYSRRCAELSASLAELLSAKQEEQRREADLRSALAHAEESLAVREEEEGRIAAELSERKEVQAEQRARREHLESHRADLEIRLERLERERTEGRERADALEEQLVALHEVHQDAEARLEDLGRQEGEGRARREAVEKRLEEAREGARQLESHLQELKKEQLDRVENLQDLRNSQADLESEERALKGTRRKLVQRTHELSRSLENLARDRRRLAAVREQVGAERRGLEAELSQDDDFLSGLFRERQDALAKLEKIAAAAAADRSRLQVLEDALSRHEGIDEQVRGLLERAASGESDLSCIDGLVGDLITAAEGTARAVEAALGPRAEALVVPHREAANALLELVRREGLDRVRVISRAELPAAPRPSERCALLGGAEYDERDAALLQSLLGRFDLLPPEVPLALCAPRPGRALVSADGDVMPARYETVSRGRGHSGGLITRRAETARLQRAVERGEATAQALQEEVRDLEGRVEAREQERELRARRRDEAAAREAEVQHDLRSADERLGMLRDELTLDHRELIDLDRRGTDLNEQRTELVSRREAAEAEREALHRRREEGRQERAERAREVQAVEEELTALDLELAKITERTEAARHAVTASQTRLKERREECQLLQRRLQEQEEQARAMVESKEATCAEIQRLKEQLEDGEKELARRTEELEQHREQSLGLRDEVAERRRSLEAVVKQVQTLEIKEREQRLHLEMLDDRAVEDLGQKPAELRERLNSWVEAQDRETAEEEGEGEAEEAAAAAGAEADESGAEDAVSSQRLREELESWLVVALPQLQEECDRLKKALQRLGPVNLEAMDELEAVEGRATFLSRQREDLIESRRRLRSLIEEIDEECERRFAETFEKVRDHFRVLFRRLFGGGRAELVLLEADDPAEAGVDVVAAPPGKDPRSIQMLSGGERTMTAVALLFALFSTRPSPFCVLDEVDAALDDANIERFTRMLRDFLGTTQFLIVTHSKRTMTVADTIYGVTMEGNGVSRPIAMRFEEEQARGQVA